ncbi:MAG: type II secretion system protein [Candidatus Sumerlaeia bacterium]|nr:type II secretion system protein [Candidatus Sumerlaeia bacterium]
MNNFRYGFTLIELLVVVAIIAILAGIAMPNLLTAQIRSKVARVKADQRTIATALEAYAADANKYPPSTLVPLFQRLIPLTTPVSYLTDIPKDIFNGIDLQAGSFRIGGNFAYGATPIDAESRYALASFGPDQRPDHFDITFYPGYNKAPWEDSTSGSTYIRYDPTNGTVSAGDIWRTSDGPQE